MHTPRQIGRKTRENSVSPTHLISILSLGLYLNDNSLKVMIIHSTSFTRDALSMFQYSMEKKKRGSRMKEELPNTCTH